MRQYQTAGDNAHQVQIGGDKHKSNPEPTKGVPRWSWIAALVVCGVAVVLNLAIIGWLVTR